MSHEFVFAAFSQLFAQNNYNVLQISYRLSVLYQSTIASNPSKSTCLVVRKWKTIIPYLRIMERTMARAIALYCTTYTDMQTDGQTDGRVAALVNAPTKKGYHRRGRNNKQIAHDPNTCHAVGQ